MKTEMMNVRDNKLYLGDYSIDELASMFGTPLYVYDEKHLLNKILTYTENFRSDKYDCRVVYASKAFIAPYLCHLLEKHGVMIDAVSAGDLYLLGKSGFPASMIVMHGNNKSREELITAVESGIGCIVVDNLSELEELIEISEARKIRVKTLFRVNPGIEAHTHPFVQTALSVSKFGESVHDQAIIDKIMKSYQKSEYVVLDGFNAHIGSQIVDVKLYRKLVAAMARFIKMIEHTYGVSIETVDFGGGFGIKYQDRDHEIDIAESMKIIIGEATEHFRDLNVKRLMIEPGRSIVGDAGFTIYRTHRGKKTAGGIRYVFVDGGMTDNIRPALYKASYAAINADRIEGETHVYTIAGKCCESGDIIAHDIEMVKPEQDDLLVVFCTGAYCYSMSMNYNGLPKPGVIFVNEKGIKEVIKRESLRDLVRTCNFEK